MEGIYEMDNKNNLVSNSLGVKYSHGISDIFAWDRIDYSVFLNADVYSLPQ